MRSTKISNFFIDNYFEKVNPSYILVYIMLLRLCGEGECNVSRIADSMNIMEGDVRRALKFWVEKNVIKYDELDEGALKIVFLLEEVENTAKPEEPAAPAPPPLTAAVAVTRPVYTSKEIDYYLESSPALNKLFKSCQNHMGKLLSYNDMCVLFSFHDWLRMPFELIELLVEYCCSNDHRSIRYIEKVAVIWTDAGIDTPEKAKERIKLYNKDFRQIMAALGKSDREPIKAEADYMLKWLKVYNMPLDVVLAACERTVLQIPKPNFKYADGIIERWHTGGVMSLSDIEKAEAEFNASKSAGKADAFKPVIKKTRFSNFKERENVDFSEIQRLERERIDKELGL